MYKHSEKITTFIPWENIEPEAQEQILNTAEVPFIHGHVAVMPDCHYGKGATVGTVLATKGAVIPAAVGVDIGCGMIATKLNFKSEVIKDGLLKSMREGIERRIPMSAGKFRNKISDTALPRIQELEELARQGAGVEFYDSIASNWREQLGTLGGGNHFIELCIDSEDNLWATLHSGSRGIGNKIGNLYIKKAQEQCAKDGIILKDRDLSHLVEGTEDYNNYMRDLKWAQRFALLNRDEMLDQFLMEIATQFLGDWTKYKEIEGSRINCHHNFTREEEHFGETVLVTRKGAISAYETDFGLVPGSMGTRSYIIKGKGNKEALCSSPHGAGRRMSRAKAKAKFTMEDFDREMVGIEHRRSEILLDELPGAYKDIDEVMENAKELVEIITELRQVLNVKGD